MMANFVGNIWCSVELKKYVVDVNDDIALDKLPRLYQKQFPLKKGHYMIYIVILNVIEILFI
jgi:hypothetical protein